MLLEWLCPSRGCSLRSHIHTFSLQQRLLQSHFVVKIIRNKTARESGALPSSKSFPHNIHSNPAPWILRCAWPLLSSPCFHSSGSHFHSGASWNPSLLLKMSCWPVNTYSSTALVLKGFEVGEAVLLLGVLRDAKVRKSKVPHEWMNSFKEKGKNQQAITLWHAFGFAKCCAFYYL